MSAERDKALELAIAQIEKEFGKGSIMRLGEAGSGPSVDAIPTGSLSLDIALGIGGLPRGRVVELFGAESSGKTTLARAIIANPRILLLDDALSAVDAYTEDEILTRLQEVMRGRTSLIVSHRISTVRRADLILVLDHGRVVERGTHDELLAREGMYAGLYRKQLLELEMEAL